MGLNLIFGNKVKLLEELEGSVLTSSFDSFSKSVPVVSCQFCRMSSFKHHLFFTLN